MGVEPVLLDLVAWMDSRPRCMMCRRERAAIIRVAVVRIRGGAQTRKITGRDT